MKIQQPVAMIALMVASASMAYGQSDCNTVGQDCGQCNSGRVGHAGFFHDCFKAPEHGHCHPWTYDQASALWDGYCTETCDTPCFLDCFAGGCRTGGCQTGCNSCWPASCGDNCCGGRSLFSRGCGLGLGGRFGGCDSGCDQGCDRGCNSGCGCDTGCDSGCGVGGLLQRGCRGGLNLGGRCCNEVSSCWPPSCGCDSGCNSGCDTGCRHGFTLGGGLRGCGGGIFNRGGCCDSACDSGCGCDGGAVAPANIQPVPENGNQ